MITEALGNGVTYRELEARAIDPDTGQTASRGVFSDIVHGKTVRAPYDYHLRAIAVALRVPYEQVRQAAIAQWLPAEGERPSSSSRREEISDLLAEARRLIAKADELDRRDQRRHPKSA
jgi:hypothetical protein